MSTWNSVQKNYIDGTTVINAEYMNTLQSKVSERISLKDFGAIGDGAANDTTAIQAAIIFCGTNNRKLFVPSGTYRITAKITSPYAVSIEGELLSPTTTPPILQGYNGVTFLSEVSGDYCFEFGSLTYRRGGEYKNFRVFGNGVTGHGIRLWNQGWDCRIDSVTVEGFVGKGIVFDYVQDALVSSLCVINCGIENSEASIEMLTNCNSIHFERLHCEITPYMLRMSACRDISFSGCHFEVSEYPSAPLDVLNRYSRYPMIVIQTGSADITFNQCLFAPGSVQGIAAHYAVAESAVGHFMGIYGSTAKISNCAFTQTQSGKSSKMIIMDSITSGSVVHNCTFMQAYTDDYSFVLSGTCFSDNLILWNDVGGTLLYGIKNATGGTKSRVIDNTLYCLNSGGAAKTAGYLFNSPSVGSCLEIGDNYTVVSKMYKHHNVSCVPVTKNYATNRTFVNGFTALDLELYDHNTLFGFSSGSTTITSITNMMQGQEVRFFSYGVPLARITNGGGQVVLKGGVNADIPANGYLTLAESFNGYLCELNRSF